MRYTYFALAGLIVSGSAIAQPAPTVAAGTRVRITAPALFAGRQAGTVAAVAGDSLVVRMPRREMTLPLSLVERLDVSRGRSRARGALKGFGIGALIGAVGGAIVGLAVDEEGGDFSAAGAAAFVGLMGAAAGGTVGIVVGAAFPSERWERAPLAPRVAPAPSPAAGLALVLTHRF